MKCIMLLGNVFFSPPSKILRMFSVGNNEHPVNARCVHRMQTTRGKIGKQLRFRELKRTDDIVFIIHRHLLADSRKRTIFQERTVTHWQHNTHAALWQSCTVCVCALHTDGAYSYTCTVRATGHACVLHAWACLHAYGTRTNTACICTYTINGLRHYK